MPAEFDQQFDEGWRGFPLTKRVRDALFLARAANPEQARSIGRRAFMALPSVGAHTVDAIGRLIGGWPDQTGGPVAPRRASRPARRAIQLAIAPFATATGLAPAVTALCDDGSIWQFAGSPASWQRLPALPEAD